MSAQLERNRLVVREFLDLVFNQHAVDEGIARCIGPTYRQHNTQVADGVENFRQFFTEFFRDFPQSSLAIKRLIAEDDLVAVHLHWQSHPDQPGDAVMDFFRLQDGRIVEHWDVIQPVASQSANNNSMF
ncbi:ester cyclase [Pseudomonas sp. BF-R-01]|jgi:predicted SnoaL-like aldol condensation-catalyzing enzyme|uniref:nuclear transport factor 2 family protein n=1 Tax=Pseudomonas sp. BF-R-01 TaxID=2832365 RepID=UPI001CBF293E|nr:ester cyclase [Pseudomonas sp. BF-R-01]